MEAVVDPEWWALRATGLRATGAALVSGRHGGKEVIRFTSPTGDGHQLTHMHTQKPEGEGAGAQTQSATDKRMMRHTRNDANTGTHCVMMHIGALWHYQFDLSAPTQTKYTRSHVSGMHINKKIYKGEL